jgi:BA14K-like protein
MNRLAALLLLLMMNGAAIAQTTGTLNPAPAPAEPKVKEDVPPGGCMPIGMTASGEMVFPIQCEGIIERERGKVVEQNPSAVEVKPAIKQSEGVASESSSPAIKPVETVPVPKRRDATTSDDDCQHYRSYNRMSGTYTDYSGRRRPCR